MNFYSWKLYKKASSGLFYFSRRLINEIQIGDFPNCWVLIPDTLGADALLAWC